MKITKSQLKQIIKEELEKTLSEDPRQRYAMVMRQCPARKERDFYGPYNHWPDWIQKLFPKGYRWTKKDMDNCLKEGRPGDIIMDAAVRAKARAFEEGIIKEELASVLAEEEYDDTDKRPMRTPASTSQRIGRNIAQDQAKKIFGEDVHWDFSRRGTATWSGTLEQLQSLPEEDFVQKTAELAQIKTWNKRGRYYGYPYKGVEIHVTLPDDLPRQEFRWPGTHAGVDHYDYGSSPPALARIKSDVFGQNMLGFLQYVMRAVPELAMAPDTTPEM